eukprot:4032210-Pyramimonas_sp.AAC.1
MRSSRTAPAEVRSSEGLPDRSTARLACVRQGSWAIDAAWPTRETPAPMHLIQACHNLRDQRNSLTRGLKSPTNFARDGRPKGVRRGRHRQKEKKVSRAGSRHGARCHATARAFQIWRGVERATPPDKDWLQIETSLPQRA